MRRSTKRKVTTFLGCVLGGVTFTGPLMGSLLYDWQCRRGICTQPNHRAAPTPEPRDE